MTATVPAGGFVPAAGTPALRLSGITKSFGNVPALKGVSLEIRRNEVVGLIGENGAGKSTLLKILSGIYQPDSGVIEAHGREVRFRRPQDSVAAGIGVVHQEQSLLTNLSVAENIAMNSGPTNGAGTRFGVYRWGRLNRTAREVLARIGSDIDPQATVGDLPFVDRQMVEIARALRVDEVAKVPPIVILDEPTSILERNETETLEREIRALKQLGSVIFVSHRLDEVLRICDRILVMRSGELVADRAIADVTQDELFRLMVGHESRAPERPTAAGVGSGTPVLEIRELTKRGSYRDVSLSVHAGQCLAIVGTQGSGREDLCRAVFGAASYDSGQILVQGREIGNWTMRQAVKNGVAYVPAERKVEGMVGGLTAAENLTLAHPGEAAVGPFLRPRARRQVATLWFDQLDVRPREPRMRLDRFSGGNQQKVVMGKWLSAENLSLLVLDHPLRGLDVGAAETVNAQVQAACARGVAVLLIADTLEEALDMAHVVVVMRDGDVTARYDLGVDSTTTLDLLEMMV